MKHEWLVYVIVGVFSGGAAIAIAGVPSSEPVDATIVVPDTTVPVETTPLLVTVTEVATTDPPDTTTPPPTTTPPTTLPSETTTTLPSETTTTLPPLPDRAELTVVVANGADIGGLAGATSADLEALGYVDVSTTDGTEIAATTIVYFSEGFEASAARLAVDLDLEATLVAPVITAPQVLGTAIDDADLLVYLGQDRSY